MQAEKVIEIGLATTRLIGTDVGMILAFVLFTFIIYVVYYLLFIINNKYYSYIKFNFIA